jgi:hypothetical protein
MQLPRLWKRQQDSEEWLHRSQDGSGWIRRVFLHIHHELDTKSGATDIQHQTIMV